MEEACTDLWLTNPFPWLKCRFLFRVLLRSSENLDMKKVLYSCCSNTASWPRQKILVTSTHGGTYLPVTVLSHG